MKSRIIAACSSGILGLVLIVFGAGCGRSAGPTQSVESGGQPFPFPWSKAAVPTYGQIYVTAQSSVGGNGIVYQSGGQIYASTDHSTAGVNGGEMEAGGTQIPFNASYGYLSIAQPAFGGAGVWGLAGNSNTGVPAFTDSMYLPAVIQMSAPAAGSSVSKASGVVVQWNPDAGNDSVIVGIAYDPSVSHFADSTMPLSADYSWYTVAADNGTYTIPSNVLSGLPANAYAQIVVTRGNSKISGTDTRKFHIYGYAVANGLFRITT